MASQSSFTTFFLSFCSRNSCEVQSYCFWLGWPSEIPGIISPCPPYQLSTEGIDMHRIIPGMLHRCWYMSSVSLDGAESTLNHWAISPVSFPMDYSDIDLNFVIFNQVVWIYLIKCLIFLYAENNLHLEFSAVSHLSSVFPYCWECQCHFKPLFLPPALGSFLKFHVTYVIWTWLLVSLPSVLCWAACFSLFIWSIMWKHFVL